MFLRNIEQFEEKQNVKIFHDFMQETLHLENKTYLCLKLCLRSWFKC